MSTPREPGAPGIHPGASAGSGPDAAAEETPWRRLDPRTLLVHCGWMAAPFGSLALTALATGGRIDTEAWITLAAITASFAVVTTLGLIRWARTDFRITVPPHRDGPGGSASPTFDVRTGLLTRRLRSVPLHRIRTVDLTATPVHRVLGVTVLRAGTAGSGDGRSELSLEALTVPEAERLRAELLAYADAEAVANDPVVARINWRWLRYAPLTFWVIGGVFVVAGAVYRALDGIGIEAWKLGFVQRAFAEFGAGALWLTIPAALLAILALGSVGAVVLYVENWWNYCLEWTDARTLRVRRGLLTTRAVTIERARLRGVALREPLLLRAGGGALVRAVAGGLGNREENRKRSGLLPCGAPRAGTASGGRRPALALPGKRGTGGADAAPQGRPAAGAGCVVCCSWSCRAPPSSPVSARRSPPSCCTAHGSTRWSRRRCLCGWPGTRTAIWDTACRARIWSPARAPSAATPSPSSATPSPPGRSRPRRSPAGPVWSRSPRRSRRARTATASRTSRPPTPPPSPRRRLRESWTSSWCTPGRNTFRDSDCGSGRAVRAGTRRVCRAVGPRGGYQHPRRPTQPTVGSRQPQPATGNHTTADAYERRPVHRGRAAFRTGPDGGFAPWRVRRGCATPARWPGAEPTPGREPHDLHTPRDAA